MSFNKNTDKDNRNKGDGEFPWKIVPIMLVFWVGMFYLCMWYING